MHTLHNKEILRLKPDIRGKLPVQVAQPENINEHASECKGAFVLFYKDAYTLPVILLLFI